MKLLIGSLASMFDRVSLHTQFITPMNYVIEGIGCLVNEEGDQPFKMICGVQKEFE